MTQPQYLIPINGAEENHAALTYGAALARQTEAFITLLGITEPTDAHHPMQTMLAAAKELFEQKSVPWRKQILNGYAEQAVEHLLAMQPYDLLIVSPLGRSSFRRWLTGRSIQHFLEEVSIPILYVPADTWPPKRILVCLGGLGYAAPSRNFGQALARQTGAELTFLHVVPPIEKDYPVSRAIQADWQHVHESDTIIGRSLRQAMQSARQQGLDPNLHIRHGEIIEEILDEIKSGAYNLVCMGSPYSTHGLRQLFAPNITAEIAERSGIPIYTARCQKD